MFKHLIALNTYTEPFLAMKPNDQRAMIEQLLGITELSEKAELLKELLKITRDSIKEEEIKINAISSSNERIEKNIKEIESRSKAWESNKQDKVTDLTTSIETLMEIDVDDEIGKHRENKEIKESIEAKNTLDSEQSRVETSLKRSEIT